MVVANKEPELKEILRKESIRTMAKDLKQLRETDALKEREKIKTSQEPQRNIISGAKADAWVKEEYPIPVKNTPPQKITEPVKPHNSFPNNTLPKNDFVKKGTPLPVRENSEEMRLKKYANEQEKQQIFLFQSQKSDLEKQLREVTDIKKASLASQKNNTLKEKGNGQRKLNEAIAQEQKGSSEQKEQMEKVRWSIEKTLADLDKKMVALGEQDAQLDQKKTFLASEIAQISHDLGAIYTTLKEREKNILKTKTQEPLHDNSHKPAQKAPADIKKEIQEIMQEPVKSAPLPIKEKLAILQKEGEKQRMKFMEEVEAWVKSNNSDTSS